MITQQPEALRLADAMDQIEAGRTANDIMADASAELRRLYARVQELEARVFTPEIKQTMNEAQFEAIARLKRLRVNTPTCHAARDVFVGGMTMYAAAKKHGIGEPAVQGTCKSIRAALRDCYIVITGEVPAD